MPAKFDVYADARSFLSRKLDGADMSSFPELSIRECIESCYSGGWDAYVADFTASMAAPVRVTSEEWSPVKVRLRVASMLRRQRQTLGEYEEVLSYDFSDTDVKFVLRIATVDRKARRDIVTGYTLELHHFTRATPGDFWSHDMIDMAEEAHVIHHRFGGLMSPERWAIMQEQVATCYRPGSSASPMLGWVARLGVSHADAHAGEKYPHSA